VPPVSMMCSSTSISSKVQTTSRSLGVSQALDRRSDSSTARGSLTPEFVRPWGSKCQATRTEMECRSSFRPRKLRESPHRAGSRIGSRSV
jgi:hypothetical protein